MLGIDPGSRFMGYGVVEEQNGKLAHVAHGVLKTDANAPLEQRLHVLFEGLREVAAAYGPTVAAVEGVFTLRNARSALVLGHARGIALLVAAQHGLDVHEYAPARVKKAVGSGGAGDKSSVARMVSRFLGLQTLERADATDALAVALCHVRMSRIPTVAPRRAGARADFAARLSPSVQRFGVRA